MNLQYLPRAEIDRLCQHAPDALIKARLFATACRINTLYMIMRAGSGHIGTSFSSLDLTSWLYLEELQSDAAGNGDLFYSSKGHDVPALYAVLLALGRLPEEQIHQLRQLGGLPGHPDVGTPGMVTNTGSLGMGVSKAKGMVSADRLRGKRRQIFVMTGDGELQEGQFWESLPGAANRGMGEITVLVDHNKLQSDTFVSDVSDLGNLMAKFEAFGWVARRIDGHDFAAIRDTLGELASITDRPKMVLCDTIKGCGVSFMHPPPPAAFDGLYAFHSGAPSVPDYYAAVKELTSVLETGCRNAAILPPEPVSVDLPDRTPPAGQFLVKAYGEALRQLGEKHPDLVALDADLVKDCGVVPFRAAFPERFIECGISEQDMVSQASGLALNGFLPVCHSFSCFLTPRANEQIYNATTEGTKILYLGALSGLIPAGPGHSHQSVRDIALMSCQPNLIAIEPSSERAAAEAIRFLVEETPCSGFLRVTNVPIPVPFEAAEGPLVLGHGRVVYEGTEAVIIAYGPVLLTEAWHAAEILRDEVAVRVVDLPWLNRVDPDWLRSVTLGAKLLVSIDNHYRSGGQGQLLATTFLESGILEERRFLHLALDDVPACGPTPEVLRHHGLDRDSIAQAIRNAIYPR